MAAFLAVDNLNLKGKNKILVNENQKINSQISSLIKFLPNNDGRLKPYFDFEKEIMVDPLATTRKNKDALDAIASAMSLMAGRINGASTPIEKDNIKK